MAFESISTTSVLEFPGYFEGVDFSRRNEEEFLEYAYDHLRRYEAFVPNLYLDTGGKVTVGIGHLLPNEEAATRLLFEFRIPPIPPRAITDQDKKDEWKRMKDLASSIKRPIPVGTSEFFRERTSLDLQETDAKILFFKDTTIRLTELKNIFSNYAKFPDSAKLGILDVYFNVGGGRGFAQFVKFRTAVIKQNWLRAKDESERKDISRDRNEAVYRLFQDAYEIQKEKKVPTNSLEKALEKKEVRDALRAESKFDDIW